MWGHYDLHKNFCLYSCPPVHTLCSNSMFYHSSFIYILNKLGKYNFVRSSKIRNLPIFFIIILIKVEVNYINVFYSTIFQSERKLKIIKLIPSPTPSPTTPAPPPSPVKLRYLFIISDSRQRPYTMFTSSSFFFHKTETIYLLYLEKFRLTLCVHCLILF